VKISRGETKNSQKDGLSKTGACTEFDPAELPETNAIISALSHDLRSPLNTIIGFSEILLSKRIGKLNEDQQKEIRIILKRGNLLLSMLDQLIDYSRFIRREQKIESATLSLNSLLISTVERIRTNRPAEAPPLVYRPAKGPYRIQGDEQKLHRTLMQIIQEGEEFFKPREIRISLGKIRKQKAASPQQDFRIGIQFLGRGMMNLRELPAWDGDRTIPGKTKFAWHLADFYMRLMKGKFGVSKKKGSIEFTLDFCEEENNE